jgi:hypothetical protein
MAVCAHGGFEITSRKSPLVDAIQDATVLLCMAFLAGLIELQADIAQVSDDKIQVRELCVALVAIHTGDRLLSMHSFFEMTFIYE